MISFFFLLLFFAATAYLYTLRLHHFCAMKRNVCLTFCCCFCCCYCSVGVEHWLWLSPQWLCRQLRKSNIHAQKFIYEKCGGDNETMWLVVTTALCTLHVFDGGPVNNVDVSTGPCQHSFENPRRHGADEHNNIHLRNVLWQVGETVHDIISWRLPSPWSTIRTDVRLLSFRCRALGIWCRHHMLSCIMF